MQLAQQFRHGRSQHGMNGIGRDLGKREQDECTPVHERMGHLEIRFLNDLIPEKQNVEVYGPGPPFDRSHPPDLRLSLEQYAQQFTRGEVGLKFRGRVQETPLPRAALGYGLDRPTDPKRSNVVVRGQGLNSPTKVRFSVAEIGAQTDKSLRHRRLPLR